MKHFEDKLPALAGNPDLYYQIWEPEKNIKAVMVLIHGLGEHGGRYGGDFASFYTDSNIAVLSPDLPGHGKTDGIRGHISDPNLFLDYIEILLDKVKARYPKKPVFLYGHSMGGLITLWYTLARSPKLNGVIVTSPAIGTKDPVPSAKKFMAVLMNAVMPTFTMNNGLDVNQLSRDKKVVEAYTTDPLVHRLVSARLGLFIIRHGEWILAHAKDNKNDMLVMIGSKEGIVDKVAVDQFCQLAPHVDYKVWPELFHEIHNEPEKNEVYQYTKKWIYAHLSNG
jgi:acylglycerol lipase